MFLLANLVYMLRLNPMLLDIIKNYKDPSSGYYTKLLKTYNKNLIFCNIHDFYSQSISRPTLIRWVNFLYNIFSLQLILNKKLYLPGIWLFVIEPEDFIPGYNFPDTFKEKIQINDKLKFEDKNFILEILINWKINYKKLDETTIQVRKKTKKSNEDIEEWDKKNKFTFYSNFETKIRYINERILAESWLQESQLQIKLIQKYSWWKEFENIKNDYEKNKDFWFLEFLNHIFVWNIAYETKILEDIVLLIWYIENNQDDIIF